MTPHICSICAVLIDEMGIPLPDQTPLPINYATGLCIGHRLAKSQQRRLRRKPVEQTETRMPYKD